MKNPIIKYGLYMALAFILIYTALYFINPSLIFNLIAASIISFVVPIFFMVVAVLKDREINHGSITFGEAFKTSLFTYLLGSFIGTMFFWLLINVFDPNLHTLGIEAMGETAEKFIKAFGGDADDAAEVSEVFKKEINPFSFSLTMLDWLGSVLFPNGIIAVIIAAVLRKNG